MASIKRNYIDSHWLVFMFQGAIALLFGCLTLFVGDYNSSYLIPMIGISLVSLAVVELANSTRRRYYRHGWLVSLLVAVFDAAAGVLLLFMANQPIVWHMGIIAGYTALRGVFEIVVGFQTTIDPTDRFIWVLCGMCGAVFGFVIFNSGELASVDYIRFFGAYMLILGVSSLIYGVHNRAQKIEDHEARSAVARKSRKTSARKSVAKE